MASAASSRFGESSRCVNAAPTGASTASRNRDRKPPIRRELEERRREQHGVGLGEHVARADVRELVREDRLELGRRRAPSGARS